MYCDHCGKPLAAGAQFCTVCGARILPGAAPAPYAPQALAAAPSDRVRRHLGLLSALWAINGVLRLLETLAFSFIGPTLFPGIFAAHAWGSRSFPFLWTLWPLSMGIAWISVLFGALGFVYLVLAWGLHERKTWARPLGLVIGILALFRFPLGTALGIYTLWVLLPEPSRREYDHLAVA